MIELKKEFSKKGTKFTQVFKDSEIVVYRLDRNFFNGTNGFWYEIFKPKVKKADIYHNDEYELYPGDEQFGAWAWSCSTKGSVEKILNKHFNGMSDEKKSEISQICYPVQQ